MATPSFRRATASRAFPNFIWNTLRMTIMGASVAIFAWLRPRVGRIVSREEVQGRESGLEVLADNTTYGYRTQKNICVELTASVRQLLRFHSNYRWASTFLTRSDSLVRLTDPRRRRNITTTLGIVPEYKGTRNES